MAGTRAVGEVPGLFPCEEKKPVCGTSLVVQWVRCRASNAGGPGSIPGQGTRSHMPVATKKSARLNEDPACLNKDLVQPK